MAKYPNEDEKDAQGYQAPTDNSLAAAILLNGTLALGTFLGVALDPVRRLAVVVTFLEPHLSDHAYDRSMSTCLTTSKAPLVRFRTLYRRDDRKQRVLPRGTSTVQSVRAPWVRAELDGWCVGNVVSHQEFHVARAV